MGSRPSLGDISEIDFLESIQSVSGTEGLKMVCVIHYVAAVEKSRKSDF